VDDLLARAATGDQAAFSDLVRAHQGMVFGLAYNYLRDRALAEELAQDVFLSLYRHLGSIESPAHLKFWLRKVTSHRCIDVARRHRVHIEQFSDEMPEPASPFRQPDPMLSATVRRLVATLPDGPRMVVTLRYQEDLEPSEIATILDMPVNTVKSHLRRSIQILREKVTRYLGEEVEV